MIPIPNQSYSDACCREIQKACQEDYVSWCSDSEILLVKTYQVDDGDGHYDTMTDNSINLTYCPFCGKKL